MKKELSNYEKDQIIHGQSFEEENINWNSGQKKSIDEFLIPLINLNSLVLDAACGDGSGIEHLINKGYKNIFGVDINDNKLERAIKKVGKERLFNNHISELQFKNDYFDFIWSSHTLEHSDNPIKSLNEFIRVLKPGGNILLILPYPTNQHSIHCGVSELLLDINDNANSCINNLKSRGFSVEEYKIMNIREPELFIKIKK